jgi:predicted transcriptional regulator
MPFKKPRDAEIIDRPDQVRALSSQMRCAIHQVVLNQGEVSIREIAEQLGRKPVSLYRHIDQLLDVGVLEEVGTRATTRRDAKIYTTQLNYLRYRPEDEEMTDAMCSVTKCMLKSTATGVVKSLKSKDAIMNGKARDTYISSPIGWLDEEELTELNTHLSAIMKLFRDKPRKSDAKLIAVSVGMYPMPVIPSKPE